MKSSDVDRCYVLNLDRRPDRYEAFCARRKEIADWPFPEPIRYSGVDGFEVPPPGWWRERPGAWGCLASYVKMFREVVASDSTGIVLCLEDDAMFKANFAARVTIYLAALPEDWQIAYLGCLHWGIYVQPPKPVNRQVIRPQYASGTHGWLIRTSFMPTVIDWVLERNHWLPHEDRGLQQIDQRLGQLQALGKYAIYAPWENLVGQVANESDISHLPVGPCFWDLLDDVTGRWVATVKE